MAKKEKSVDFQRLVVDKKLPILTLDGRWHELFTEEEKTARIKQLEQEVNDLLKKQGKLVNEIKDMKRLKSSLLNEIMANMDVSNDKTGQKGKKLNKNKQFIHELNDKIDQSMEALAELPYQIKKVNEKLVTESITIFYNLLKENHREISEVTEWIAGMREELKVKMLLKQDLETKNSKIYTYMHDILGPEMMEHFDNKNGFGDSR